MTLLLSISVQLSRLTPYAINSRDESLIFNATLTVAMNLA